MDDHFGSKLEQARTRQGITLREASDATKIRTDFLLSFENDHGNVSMPEIYKRGFIKLYARYLKLDPEEIVQDYLAYHQTDSKKAKKDGKEIFGRIHLPETETDVKEEESFLEQSQLPLHNIETIRSPSDPERNYKHSEQNLEETKSLYLKIGLMFGGGLALVILIGVLLTSAFRSHSTDTLVAHSHAAKSSKETTKKPAVVKNDFVEELTLIGEGSEVEVTVMQENDKAELFSGYLQPNKPVSITRKGPVKIRYSDGSQIVIQRANGEKLCPGGKGNWIKI